MRSAATQSPTPTATPTTVPPTPAPLYAVYTYDGDGNMVKSVVNGVTTYYPGRHYNKEVNGIAQRTQKFYQAAGQTIAVRTNNSPELGPTYGELKWTLSDHLGSTSVTANADGTWNSELRYTPYGEIRYNSGITPTDYRYTGQLQQAELGLYYYVARWYDPYINRFIQADTIIPGAANPIAWDRYAGMGNNPIVYNDPTGHWPGIFDLIIEYALAAVGATDMAGITAAEVAMGGNEGSIEVAAGLAVQGEFSGIQDHIAALVRHGDWNSDGSGFGLAQTNSSEINDLGLRGSPEDPTVAVQVMQARIGNAQGACKNCTPQDMLVVAALAQNRQISPEDVGFLAQAANGDGIDWGNYFDIPPSTPGQIDAQIREVLTGLQYGKNFMLLKYVVDMQELHQRGWNLPKGITESDLDKLKELARSK